MRHRLAVARATAVAAAATPAALAQPTLTDTAPVTPDFTSSVVTLADDFSWGYRTGVKQHLGAYRDGLSLHQLSRIGPGGGTTGSPDYILWVDELEGDAGIAMMPTGDVTEDVVNPGGTVWFDSDPEGRIWYTYGSRAYDLPLSLYRSTSPYDPTDFELVLPDFAPDGASSTPCVMIAGDDSMLFWRKFGSPFPHTTIRVRRDNKNGDFSSPDFEYDIGKGYLHPEYGKIGMEQFYTRYDPRFDRTTLSWQWFRVEPHKFGSNPFLYSDDHAATWRRADGSLIEDLPISYDEIDPVLVPVDHVDQYKDVNWFPRDIGVSPNGVNWMTLPRGVTYVTGEWHLRLLRWVDGQWVNSRLTNDLYKSCKPHALGVTKNYMVLAYAEADDPNVLKVKFSADDGATWSFPEVLDVLPGADDPEPTAIVWVSFAQPTEAYDDDTARFFYSYYRESDDNFGRNYMNSVKWVSVHIGPECGADYNGDGTADIADFIAFQQDFTAGDPKADCNGDDRFDVLDFVCFQQTFAQGCN